MKRFLTATTAIATLTAGMAFAATDIDAVDLDGNGFASMEEMKTVYPELTTEFFNDMDVNDDRRLDAQEIVATEAQDILSRYEMAPVDASAPRIVLDADGDGFISADDLRRGYPMLTDVDFEEMDSNDDNRLDYEEFYATESQDIVAKYEMATIMDIESIDTDGDEFASFEELVVAYPGLDQESFEEIDQNDDNRVSSNELYAPEAQVIVSRSGS